MTKKADIEIIAAMTETLGNYSKAAKILEMNRQSLYRRVGKSEPLTRQVNDIKQMQCDLAEEALFKSIQEGNLKAVIYYLEKSPVARERGYGSAQHNPENNKERVVAFVTEPYVKESNAHKKKSQVTLVRQA